MTLKKGRDRGFTLIEVLVAFAILAFTLAAAYGVFADASRAVASGERYGVALALAETAIERASAPSFLTGALAEGGASLSGDGWRVDAAPMVEETGPLALIRLIATAGAQDAAGVTLETIRGIPR